MSAVRTRHQVPNKMLPYFLHLDKELITEETKQKLLDLSLSNVSNFISYKTQKNNVDDGNHVLKPSYYDNLSEVKTLLESCALKCFPIGMMHKPHSDVPKHTDDPNKRNTIIIIPLQPKENFPPTFFWANEHDEVPVATCDFGPHGAIFNTQIFHSLVAGPDIRVNFQLCFDEPFDFVADLYKQGRLFRNIP